MREVKFRGKTKKGKWVYGYYLKGGGIDYIFSDIYLNPDDPDFNSGMYEVTPETVGQFTGLKDKNGVDIYEGDHFGEPAYPVEFIDGCFLHECEPLHDGYGIIQGNIHENK